MKKVNKKHTHFSLPIEIRFTAIPTRWTEHYSHGSGERALSLVPHVNQHIERKPSPISEPEEIRKRFFKMDINEKTVLEFLNEVGVWGFAEESQLQTGADGLLLSGNTVIGEAEMQVLGAFGHRWLGGYALIETVDSLRREQKHWRSIARSRAKLRAEFKEPPATSSTPAKKEMFALTSGLYSLPVHLEWKGKSPRAVIQPVTGRELLVALAWIDLVGGAECKVCQNTNCDIEYTRGGSKYCSRQCEHANTVRAWRHRKRDASRTKRSLEASKANRKDLLAR